MILVKLLYFTFTRVEVGYLMNCWPTKFLGVALESCTGVGSDQIGTGDSN